MPSDISAPLNQLYDHNVAIKVVEVAKKYNLPEVNARVCLIGDGCRSAGDGLWSRTRQ